MECVGYSGLGWRVHILLRGFMVDYREARDHLRKQGLPFGPGNSALVVEALQRGVEVAAVRSKPRILFRHNGKEHRWQNGHTTLNSPLARKIASFKDLQSRMFLNHGINAPENAVFSPGDAERAWNWAEPLGTLVVKPHNGTHGTDVHVGIDSWDAFIVAFERVTTGRGSALVEKFHSGVEHRCLVVDNKLVAATRRRPASVEGDGNSTIEELVNLKNQSRGRVHKRLNLDERERDFLRHQGLHFDSVPSERERVYLTGASNIHAGGDAIDATRKIARSERVLIERATTIFPGLRVVGLDVLLPRRDGDSEPTIIEINHAPMTSMHHFPLEGRKRNVSAAIMDAMFPETKTQDREVQTPAISLT
jgi:D-alanine-D-alanine ligase-like ATP-grasp enzyme